MNFFLYRELPLFIVLGLTGMFGNQLLYLLGIYYTNANIASIFQPAIPVWTALLAIIVRIEPFPDFRTLRGWAKSLGILLAAVGAIVMTVEKKLAKHQTIVDHPRLAASILWGIYSSSGILCPWLCISSFRRSLSLTKRTLVGKRNL